MIQYIWTLVGLHYIKLIRSYNIKYNILYYNKIICNQVIEYIEANLIIPSVPWYNEDVLFPVISDIKYGERVPVQIGCLVIDYLVLL